MQRALTHKLPSKQPWPHSCSPILRSLHSQALAACSDRPIKFVSPSPPGTALDVVMRLIAEQMAGTLGQPMAVEMSCELFRRYVSVMGDAAMPILRASPEFLVNATTANSQSESSTTALADGRFVVTWTDASGSTGDTSGWAIRARIFNADGTQSVQEFLVNTTTANNQAGSRVTALADGRFLVSWTDASASTGDTSSNAVLARIFNADGTQSVPEFLVNTTTASDQYLSNVTALADGRFVVTWTDASASTGDTSSKRRPRPHLQRRQYAIRARVRGQHDHDKRSVW